MATREIWHEILINASPAAIYVAVMDVHKLAHWWTTDVRGESKLGGKLEFWFSGFLGAVMEVTTLQPSEMVQWRVVGGGAGDWIGTKIEFKILHDAEKTLVYFRR